MPREQDERDKLVRAICASVRTYAPRQRVDAYFKMRQRLRKTSIQVLREILEQDIVNVDGGDFVREAARQ